jgi:hypothetical protein
MARCKAVITSAPILTNKGLWGSHIWREGEVGVTVPDYVAIGVLIVLIVWAMAIGFREASYSGAQMLTLAGDNGSAPPILLGLSLISQKRAAHSAALR